MKTGTKPGGSTEHGFTLVESLGVVVVIGILAALLWPAFASTRERALSSKCVFNLRQVGVALFAYAGDHQSKILPHIEPDPDNPKLNLSNTYWHQVLRKGGYFGPPPDVSTSAKKAAAQMAGVHFCPSIPSRGGSEESYGMRRWRTPGQSVWDITQNLLVIENRADFFLMVDSYKPATKTQGYMVNPGSTSYRIQLAHGGLANTLFADGHVAAMNRAYFEELPVRQKAYQNSLPFSYWPEETR